MSNEYEITGYVTELREPQEVGTRGNCKHGVMVDPGGTRSKMVLIEFWNDLSDEVACLDINDKVRIVFTISSSPWRDRVFTNLTGVSVQVLEGDRKIMTKPPEPPKVPSPVSRGKKLPIPKTYVTREFDTLDEDVPF